MDYFNLVSEWNVKQEKLTTNKSEIITYYYNRYLIENNKLIVNINYVNYTRFGFLVNIYLPRR